MLLFLLLFCVHCASAAGPMCYECDDVSEARDCTNIVTCGDHEQCYVQRFIASNLRQYFKLGCIQRDACLHNQESLFGFGFQTVGKRSQYGKPNVSQKLTRDVTSLNRKSRATDQDMVLCLECSNDQINQISKCGSKETNNLRCFKCTDVLTPHDCDTIVECGQDERCFVGKQPVDVQNGQNHYKMGCHREAQCNTLQTVSHSIGCLECCNESYCNFAACDGTNSSKTTTQAPTAASTTVPPIHKPVVTIVGPSAADYNIPVNLTCQTDVPVDSYSWAKDGHQLASSHSPTLTIPALNENSTGTYRCLVFRNQQSGFADKSVLINAKPGHVISFVHALDPQSGLLTLHCIYEGYPPPVIDWSFVGATGTHLASGIEINPERSIGLIFNYNSGLHVGSYTCGARNYLGGDNKTTTMH